MKANFIEVDRYTPYLLPPSVQDWLPEKHLARFVVEIVEQLDLNSLKESYAGRGSKPYHPRKARKARGTFLSIYLLRIKSTKKVAQSAQS
jgi:transposase